MYVTPPSDNIVIEALRKENAALRRRIDRIEIRERERQGLRLDRLERTAQASQLAVFDWMDISVDEIYFTRPVYRILGYEPFSFVASFQFLLDAVHPSHKTAFDIAVRKALYEVGSVSEEVRIRCADGSFKWIEFTAKASTSADGTVVRFTGSFRDITVQQAARAEVSLLSERLALVVAGSRACVWEWLDMSKDDIYFSPEALALVGFDDPKYHMTHAVFRSLVHPEDIAIIDEAITCTMAAGGGRFEVDYRMRFRTRGYRWIRSSGSIVRNPHTGVVRLTGSVIDIHDGRTLEAELAKTAAHLQLALQSAKAGMWDWHDVSQPNVYFSTGMLDMLGYASTEVEASVTGFQALMHPDDRAQTQAILLAALESGLRFSAVYRIYFKERGYRWVHSSGTPERNGAGQVRRIAGCLLDVHEHERDRRALAANAARHCRLYAMMTDSLVEPLLQIEALCQLIRDEPAPTTALDLVSIIEASNAKARGVIDEMLAI